MATGKTKGIIRVEEVDVLEGLCKDLIKSWKSDDIDTFSRYYTALVGLINTRKGLVPPELHPIVYLDKHIVYENRVPVERAITWVLEIMKWSQDRRDTRYR